MSTVCLNGISFSLTGEVLYFNSQPSFAVVFEIPAEEQEVLSYEWFLNEELLVDIDGKVFSANIPYGQHRVAVKLLTASGWTGLKYLNFQTYGNPISQVIAGPAAVREGDSVTYSVLATYAGGVVFDFSNEYTFSCPDGSFNGNVFTAYVNPQTQDTRPSLITANKTGGGQPLSRQITILDSTAPQLVSLAISGPLQVNEGQQYLYKVMALYNNGVSFNVTNQAKLSLQATDRGSFSQTASGAQLDVYYNIYLNDTITSQITASYLDKTASQNVSIRDTTANTVTLSITGPSSVREGETVAYQVQARFANGKEARVTDSYNFSCPDGVFDGNNFTANTNITANDNRLSIITASAENVPQVTRQITILDATAPKWGNTIQSAVFTRDNCTAGYTGSSVTYTIKANTYFSEISQQDADQLALSDILQNGQDYANTNGMCVSASSVIQIANFDHLLIDFDWQVPNGRDLDVLVGFENNGSVYDARYVGYGGVGETYPQGTTPKSNAYLWWGQDNRGDSGTEGIIVNLKRFVATQQNLPVIIEVGLYAVWYGEVASGNFAMGIKAYRGGTMQQSANTFINSGGIQVANYPIPRGTLLRKTGNVPNNYYKAGTIRYNRITQEATVYV